jgi:non-specific serine/threonine protein kinase
MAGSYEQVGRPSKAYPFVEKLERQDPLNPRRYIMRGYYYLYDCQFEPALEQFHLLYQADPTSPLAQTSYSNLLAYNGKRDEALAVIDRVGKTNKTNVMNAFSLLLKYALLNDKERALWLITTDLRKTCWRDYEWSYWVANRLAFAGAKKEALDWLENAVNRGFINYPFLQCDPFLNNIRGEERFKKLMEHAKYEWEHFEVPE